MTFLMSFFKPHYRTFGLAVSASDGGTKKRKRLKELPEPIREALGISEEKAAEIAEKLRAQEKQALDIVSLLRSELLQRLAKEEAERRIYLQGLEAERLRIDREEREAIERLELRRRKRRKDLEVGLAMLSELL